MRLALRWALAALAWAAPAAARPGGGHSFHSSSSSHSYSSHSYSSGSSWHSSGSSGSSWHSSGSGSSYGSSYGSSSSGSSYGSTYGSTTPYDDSYVQGLEDQSSCSMECVNEQMSTMGAPDAGVFDQASCEKRCVAEKLKNRLASAPPPSTSSPVYVSPPPDPPMTRRFLPLTVVFGILAAFAGIGWGIRRRNQREWSTWAERVDEVEPTFERQARSASIEAALADLGAADAGFSRVLFEDFLYALYAEVHAARGGGKLARLAPYLGDRARASLEKWPADAVEGIIVGSATLRDVRTVAATRTVRVVVHFETNYTERAGGSAQSFYAREEWVLERSADAKSRPPDRARVIGCASCGAPLEKIVGGACSYCGAAASGAVDWRVVDAVFVERETRGPILTGTTEEVGTDLPTLVASDVKTRWTELQERDPAVTWPALSARIEHVFGTFHRTWAAQELAEVRPLLSDMLFETQRYWVAAYRAQGLRNVTEDPAIVTIQLSKIVSDAWLDAITVRVFATCKDYTLDAAGRVVGGSRTRERRYSEYWTFIRSAKRTGAPKTDSGCPSCGAPIGSIGMAGKCESCGAKITTGDFDWILSRIEQDEVYEL